MDLLLHKELIGGVVDVDTTSRRVVMDWSATEEVDHDNDLIRSTAYTKTISERGPKGKGLIYWLTDHEASVRNVPGKLTNLQMVGNKLQATATASDTRLGNDMMQLYLDGIIRQHSVGIAPVKTEGSRAKDYRVIQEVVLYEGSSVLWGANENTPTVSVGKSLMTLEQCNDEMDLLLKAWRNATYSDETFGILELRIKQIQKYYSELIAPSADTQEPAKTTQNAELIKSLNNLKNLLK